MRSEKAIVVGLTGNYGSGKSHILNLFKEMGAFTINSDEIIRELLKEEDIKKEIRELLGDEVFTENGEVDRKAIADLIFKDAYLRIKLEDIIHPRVFKEIERLISTLEGKRVVIIEVPVLFERGYQNRFDKIITVYGDETTIINRLKDKGIREEEIRKRWNSQFPYRKKLSSSDFIIDNSEGRDLFNQVKTIYHQLSKELKGDNRGDQKTGGDNKTF